MIRIREETSLNELIDGVRAIVSSQGNDLFPNCRTTCLKGAQGGRLKTSGSAHNGHVGLFHVRRAGDEIQTIATPPSERRSE